VTDTNNKDQQKHLIDLIINSNKTSIRFVQFLILIEASLFTAFGFWLKDGYDKQEVSQLMPFVISFIGSLAPCLILWIIYKQIRWERYWWEKYGIERIFPPVKKKFFSFGKEDGKNKNDDFEACDLKHIRRVFILTAVSVIIFWVLVLCFFR